jgi:hypothetical protein
MAARLSATPLSPEGTHVKVKGHQKRREEKAGQVHQGKAQGKAGKEKGSVGRRAVGSD